MSRWLRSRVVSTVLDLFQVLVEVAEFFMGHDIDRLGYDQSPWNNQDWFEEQYLKAEPWLNVLSDDPEKVPLKDVKRMQRHYEKAYREIREELEYLKELIGE